MITRHRPIRCVLSLLIALLFTSLFATPILAQARFGGFELHTGDGVFLSHLAGPKGEGVDVRLPQYRIPPGLDDPLRVAPVVEPRFSIVDAEGKPIATIDDLAYPPTGLTLKFTTGEILEDTGSGYTQLYLDGDPIGDLEVDANGRVAYGLLITIRPIVVEPTSDGGSSGIRFQPFFDETIFSLRDGRTQAIAVKPLKALKDPVI